MSRKPTVRSDRLAMIKCLRDLVKKQQQQIAELEQELAKYKELQDRLGLKNADEFEWFVMLDLLLDDQNINQNFKRILKGEKNDKEEEKVKKIS